ncbi:uncharacterized protein LOC133648706 [Entelurus aequoreus]|uniref:uncharacterized protein LOC133648706 n=1 Tax=Entelurus aequoreus TaxID=161455 RepID=UPI002B1E2B22|nr:uncharacterized protein LOC133648706 [Entelurus aequoreus]
MNTLELFVLILLLCYEGIGGQTVFFSSEGGVAILPCNQSPCPESDLKWLYSKKGATTFLEVNKGKVVLTEPRSRRLSLENGCSLVVNNVTGGDAGYYTCRTRRDSSMFLAVLTLSSPGGADPSRDGHVTLKCTLTNYDRQCPEKSLHWVDEGGSQLRPEGGDGHEFIQELNCESHIKVKRQPGHDRKYKCQYGENDVKIQAEITPAFAGLQPRAPPPEHTRLIIITAAAVGALVLLLVVVVVGVKIRQRRQVMKGRKKRSCVITNNVKEDLPKHDESKVIYDSVTYDKKSSAHKDGLEVDAESTGVTYAIVSHKKQNASSEVKREEEEEVTYAAIRKTASTKPGDDGST